MFGIVLLIILILIVGFALLNSASKSEEKEEKKMEEKIIKAEITRIDGRDFYVQDLDDCQGSFYFSMSDIIPVVWKDEECEAVNLLEGDIILIKYSGTADGDEPKKIENVISIEVLEFADVKPEED